MGAWESSEYEDYSPPPPARSTVFVVRNGRYEPQNFMPVPPRSSVFEFDGFVGRRGAGAGCLTARPPDMRQATLSKSSVSLRRESIALPRADEDEQKANFTFTFDAVRAGTLTLYFMVTEVEDKTSSNTTSVRLVSQDEAAQEIEALDRFHYKVGVGQTYTSPPLDLSKYAEEQLCFDMSRPRHIPLALHMECDTDPHGKETSSKVLLTYLSIIPAPTSGWTCQLISQKLQHDSNTFVLHEVFGVNSKHATEIDCGNTECVICLTEPRDTAVLPCRHMCFCSYCAGIVRLQCDRCPVCRQKVHSLLQFRRDAMGEETLAASSQ
mmetsp:Transcript_22246/g.50782  ORF Transcript_22246/g.50782 Transcript_22246/m.50782 type:complete len:323 (-) Transcript_22246:94-1062(-)